MTLIPCDVCGKRPPEKLCQVTWAWYRADSARVAYRQRICTACFCVTLLPLDKDTDYEHLTCPACGIATDHDMDPVYATLFMPGQGKRQFEFPLCPACAVEIRNRAVTGAVKLEDRSIVVGPESSPTTTAATRESYWSGLGIRPQA